MSSQDLTPFVGLLDSRREQIVIQLTKAGAVSPATARTFESFDVAADEVWDALVRSGRIREGQPGYFYVFDAPKLASPRERLLKAVVFYLLIVAIPFLLMYFSAR